MTCCPVPSALTTRGQCDPEVCPHEGVKMSRPLRWVGGEFAACFMVMSAE